MPARVRLATVTIADAPSLNRWKNDPHIQATSGAEPSMETLAETHARIGRWQHSDPHQIEPFIIRSIVSNQPLGFCHLAEIDEQARCGKLGIVIGEPAEWGQGLGREALSQLIEHAFGRGLTHLAAEVYASNPRSLRLFESLGFVRESARDRSDQFFLEVPRLAP